MTSGAGLCQCKLGCDISVDQAVADFCTKWLIGGCDDDAAPMFAIRGVT